MSREEILQERLERVATIVDVIEQYGSLDETTLVQLRLALSWSPDKKDELPNKLQVYGNDCINGRCEM